MPVAQDTADQFNLDTLSDGGRIDAIVQPYRHLDAHAGHQGRIDQPLDLARRLPCQRFKYRQKDFPVSIGERFLPNLVILKRSFRENRRLRAQTARR
jgi:hypothetical protein